MSVGYYIKGRAGRGGSIHQAHVHPFSTANGDHIGLVALTQRFIETEPSTKFFVNSTVGVAMNQDVSFGSVAVTLHDGGTTSAGDTGTADTNTEFHVIQSGQNFQSTAVVGSIVQVSTNYATVTVVNSNTDLTCDVDICPNGNEAFTIDPVWAGTAVQGNWNFADSGKISLTSGNNNDTASIDANTAAFLDMSHFTAFTGKIDLATYSEANTTIIIGFGLDGTPVGNTVNLDDFINAGDFAEQNFVIPKAALGLSDQTVNGLTILISRSGGAKPTFTLDDLDFQASGDPLMFELVVDRGDRFHIHELVFAFSDNIDGYVTVSGDTQNATLLGLSHDQILGVPSLPNGFVITREKAGKTLFSANIKTLGAHLSAGARAEPPWSDGTNTFVTLRVVFPDPLILTGDPGDTLTMQINDDMSGLTQFTVSGRGSVEVRA